MLNRACGTVYYKARLVSAEDLGRVTPFRRRSKIAKPRVQC